MLKNQTIPVFSLILLLVLFSCKDSKDESSQGDASESFLNLVKDDDSEYTKVDRSPKVHIHDDTKIHQITITEILPTKRYLYLKVSENGKTYWIATRKVPVQKGRIYYYKGGLFKRNYKSIEYNKVFDSIFLVSSLVEKDHSIRQNNQVSAQPVRAGKANVQSSKKSTKKQGYKTVKISELIKNKAKYKDKTVVVKGKCIKINPNIMGRNWIHLKDGTAGKDLVITSNELVAEGETVTVQGKVVLDKDFGAGYTYDILLENAKVLTRNSN